jgi:hypothetical protein
LKQRTLALLVGAAASIGASADVDTAGITSGGNSSVLFVAIDANDNIALTVDLGLNMTDFTSSMEFTSGLRAPVAWNFASNTTNSRATGNSWSRAYNEFKAKQSGGDLQWAVLAGDAISSSQVNASNVIRGAGWLSTGNATVSQMLDARFASRTSIGAKYFESFGLLVRARGNLIEANNGAATSTQSDGGAYLGTVLKGDFAGHQTWSYLMANGESSTLQWQQVGTEGFGANPVVRQFGLETTTDSLSSNPLLVTFDINTDSLCFGCARSVSVPPIPEPGSAALLAAGLTALAWRSRRRLLKGTRPSFH